MKTLIALLLMVVGASAGPLYVPANAGWLTNGTLINGATIVGGSPTFEWDNQTSHTTNHMRSAGGEFFLDLGAIGQTGLEVSTNYTFALHFLALDHLGNIAGVATTNDFPASTTGGLTNFSTIPWTNLNIVAGAALIASGSAVVGGTITAAFVNALNNIALTNNTIVNGGSLLATNGAVTLMGRNSALVVSNITTGTTLMISNNVVSTVGGGSVTINGDGSLTLSGNVNVPASARLAWGTGGFIIMSSSAPGMVQPKDSASNQGYVKHGTNTYNGSLAVTPVNAVTPVGYVQMTNATGGLILVPAFQ